MGGRARGGIEDIEIFRHRDMVLFSKIGNPTGGWGASLWEQIMSSVGDREFEVLGGHPINSKSAGSWKF